MAATSLCVCLSESLTSTLPVPCRCPLDTPMNMGCDNGDGVFHSPRECYLKQQDLRDYLHVIAANASTYELKYFNITDAGAGNADEDDE